MGEKMQIGEVAERTGLSLRTIRYYEEVRLVVPSARSQGGFRLYTDADVERLHLVKSMKPLKLHLEDMRDLLAVLDPAPDSPEIGDPAGRLADFIDIAQRRCADLRGQLRTVEEFANMLRIRRRAGSYDRDSSPPNRS